LSTTSTRRYGRTLAYRRRQSVTTTISTKPADTPGRGLLSITGGSRLRSVSTAMMNETFHGSTPTFGRQAPRSATRLRFTRTTRRESPVRARVRAVPNGSGKIRSQLSDGFPLSMSGHVQVSNGTLPSAGATCSTDPRRALIVNVDFFGRLDMSQTPSSNFRRFIVRRTLTGESQTQMHVREATWGTHRQKRDVGRLGVNARAELQGHR